MCRSAARVREVLSWGSRWVQTKRRHSSGFLLLSGKAQIGWNGGVCGGTAGSCHTMERSGSPRRSGRHLAMPNALAQKKKAPFGALFFWCGRWDSNPHTEVLASKTRASTIPPLPLISLWPCTFTKQQADKYPYYTIFSLGLSIPRPVPTVRGLPVHRRCVRIES